MKRIFAEAELQDFFDHTYDQVALVARVGHLAPGSITDGDVLPRGTTSPKLH